MTKSGRSGCSWARGHCNTFLVTHDLVVNDPPASLSGAIDKLHVNVNTYYDLFVVLIVMSFVISAMALWRKRLYLGMVTALFGLAIFNLHYWGFGVPFVMVGAWYLVRAYRLQRNLKQSTAGGPSVTAGPASNKRYKPLLRYPMGGCRLRSPAASGGSAERRSLGLPSRPRTALAPTTATSTTRSTNGRMNTLHDACSLSTWWTVAMSPGSLSAVTTRSVQPGGRRVSPGILSL